MKKEHLSIFVNFIICPGSTLLSSADTFSTLGYSSETGGHYADSISTLSSDGDTTPTRSVHKGD